MKGKKSGSTEVISRAIVHEYIFKVIHTFWIVLTGFTPIEISRNVLCSLDSQ